MKYSFLIIHLLAALLQASTLAGQRFSCDGQLLVSSSDGRSTKISRPIYIPFNPPFLSPFASYDNSIFDALGFNSRDHFIYAIRQHTNEVVRIKNNGSYESIGSVSLADTLYSNAGDCSPTGLYLCHDYRLNQILVFDVVDDFQLVKQINLFWDPTSRNSGPFKTRLFDFAIDPNNPSVAYSFQSNFDDQGLEPDTSRGFILQININFDDPDLGKVTPVVATDPNKISHLGGLLFSAGSRLYGYGTSASGQFPKQNKLYTINTFSGQVSELLTNSPASVLSDGCSCPYSFTFSNDVPAAGMYCNNDKNTFTIRIDNNSFNTIEDVILRDTIPEGMIIEEITGKYEGNITAETGVGTHILEITDFLIPAKSTVEIHIEVLTIDARIGPALNQAFLFNLPERFNGMMASDDRSTSGEIGDPSRFYITARKLENISWEVTSPTDCLKADDGQIIVTSQQFFPGQEYEVKLRNKIGWDEFTFRVTVDQNNSFLLDSLVPGDYQVFELRSVSDNCSMAIKDTTILLEAPDHLLDLQTDSNSPVCEGQNLLLYSTVSPDGNVRWTGPDLFGSEAADPVIDKATPRKSGEYKIEAQYGYCRQIKYVDASVRPHINATLEGPVQYCERDSIILHASGKGEELTYNWSGPDSLIDFDSTLIIADVTKYQSGYYQAIIHNGACSDTVGMDIAVLPTPTLSIQDSIMTDFCTPLTLEPQITGDDAVRYTWFPLEGLSCNDCPNPQVQPIVQPSYKVKVENDYSCRDSGDIKIILEMNNLGYAPNVFVQYSDRKNDRFTFSPRCVVHFIRGLHISDRWGNSVYTSFAHTPDQEIRPWDGTVHGEPANPGVYFWSAEIELVDGTLQYVNGNVTYLK